MATVETVTIPKKLWEDAIAGQPWLIRMAAPSQVISEGTSEQLSFSVKAGVGIAVAVVAYLLLRKTLKI